MTIQVRLFASLREQAGFSEKSLSSENIRTVEDVLATLNQECRLEGSLLFAVNMEYAKLSSRVEDGDEVAFFPPVTGGAPCL